MQCMVAVPFDMLLSFKMKLRLMVMSTAQVLQSLELRGYVNTEGNLVLPHFYVAFCLWVYHTY